MAAQNANIIAAAVVIIVVLAILIITSYTKLTFPGIYVNWNDAKGSKRSYPKLLSPVEIVKWKKKITMCREGALFKYHKRGEVGTIGNATYLTPKCQRTKHSYPKKIEDDNKAMWVLFRSLYERVATALEKELGEPTTYLRKDYALPGFHIFSGDGWLASGWNVAKIHVDLQYRQLDWKDLDVDTDRTLSFTLPVSLPPGAGLYFLDMQKDDTASLLSYRNVKKEKVEYELGTLYMHNGHQYHMISPYEKGDERITLQGHAIYSKKLQKHILYW